MASRREALCSVSVKVLPYCERLMLASRRAKKRVSALKHMRLRSDVAVGQHLDRNSNTCKIVMFCVILQVDKTSAMNCNIKHLTLQNTWQLTI